MTNLKERVPGYIRINGGWTINQNYIQSIFNYSVKSTIPYKGHYYYGYANIVAFVTSDFTYYGFRRIAKTQQESYNLENVDVFDDFDTSNSIAFEMELSVEDVFFYCMKTSDFIEIISSQKTFAISLSQVSNMYDDWIDLFPKTFDDFKIEFSDDISEYLYMTHDDSQKQTIESHFQKIFEAGIDIKKREEAYSELKQYVSSIKK